MAIVRALRHMKGACMVSSCLVIALSTAGAPRGEEELAGVARAIRMADYRGDRDGLRKAAETLAPWVDAGPVAPDARYWRGFALWRRALNGFNDGAPVAEIEADLIACRSDFRRAVEMRPPFIEAAIGEAGCEIGLLTRVRTDSPAAREHLQRARTMLDELNAVEPANPRLLWLLGGALLNTPAPDGTNRSRAVDTYLRGLAAARRERVDGGRFPGWGEPELLISLAWSSLHGSPPDLESAQTYAQAALHLVPDWRYARDVLLPQIVSGRESGLRTAPPLLSLPIIDVKAELAAIQRMRDRDVHASKTKDFAALAALFTDDAVAMIPGSGIQRPHDRPAAMAAMAEAMQTVEVLAYEEQFEETQLVRDLDGNLLAIEWGTITGRSRPLSPPDSVPQESSYRVMRILRKMSDGEWRIHRTMYN
jgi:uncharacterized protein (TIGR02246 family)